jgi:nitroreductase
MEFGEVLRRRRMVREYLDTPVPAASLERIVGAALTAPSAGFAQGQSLIIVTDVDQRHRIAVAAREPDYVDRGFPRWLSVAPVHIIVTVSEQIYLDRYREPDKLGPDIDTLDWEVPYWWVDGGTTLMAILLAAANEGLAAGFQGAHNFDGLGDIVGLPATALPLGVITIGFAADSEPRPSSAQRGRKHHSNIVHYDRW